MASAACIGASSTLCMYVQTWRKQQVRRGPAPATSCSTPSHIQIITRQVKKNCHKHELRGPISLCSKERSKIIHGGCHAMGLKDTNTKHQRMRLVTIFLLLRTAASYSASSMKQGTFAINVAFSVKPERRDEFLKIMENNLTANPRH